MLLLVSLLLMYCIESIVLTLSAVACLGGLNTLTATTFGQYRLAISKSTSKLRLSIVLDQQVHLSSAVWGFLRRFVASALLSSDAPRRASLHGKLLYSHEAVEAVHRATLTRGELLAAPKLSLVGSVVRGANGLEQVPVRELLR